MAEISSADASGLESMVSDGEYQMARDCVDAMAKQLAKNLEEKH